MRRWPRGSRRAQSARPRAGTRCAERARARLLGQAQLAALAQRLLSGRGGRSAHRWPSQHRERPGASAEHHEVALLVDTFTRYFEPENVRAAVAVLRHAGYEVHIAAPRDGERPLCCGRTFLAQGLVDEARDEAQRMLDRAAALYRSRHPGAGARALVPVHVARRVSLACCRTRLGLLSLDALLFEEFLDAQARAGRLALEAARAAAAQSPAARALSPEGVRRDGRRRRASCGWCRSSTSRRSCRAAAAWRARSATRPRITRRR